MSRWQCKFAKTRRLQNNLLPFIKSNLIFYLFSNLMFSTRCIGIYGGVRFVFVFMESIGQSPARACFQTSYLPQSRSQGRRARGLSVLE